LLGLLGTVLGMIQGFTALASEAGQVQMRIVADGISVALLTTFAGLVIAVPTLVAHQALVHRADRIANEIQRYGVALVRFLKAEEIRLFDTPDEPGDWERRESPSMAT
jgi:biopolymer transport protein ExbB